MTDDNPPEQPMPIQLRTAAGPRPIPGQSSPEAYVHALERLVEAMLHIAGIPAPNMKPAADCYRTALRIAIASAATGAQPVPVERVLTQILKRLDAHQASLPNGPRPGAA